MKTIDYSSSPKLFRLNKIAENMTKKSVKKINIGKYYNDFILFLY